MKRLSIKGKVTLWYTAFMSLFVILMLGFLLVVSSSRILSDAKLRLKDIVTKSFHDIAYEDGFLDFDDDIRELGDGVYLSVYDANGHLLYGRIPSLFEGAPLLIMDEIQQVSSGNTLWYVYDYCQYIEGYGNLWIRGIASQSQSDAILRTLVKISLILFPFLVLGIALGGYTIIRRALHPLDTMTETARQVSEGSDLSRRIRLTEGTDEVHRLAHTFDRMMEKLQASFESEKQFTSDVSHELRTPVTVILSQCEYASRNDATWEEIHGCISVIASQARKMSNLISQLLTLARTDSGTQNLHPELLNMSELLEIIVEEQKEPASQKGITLSLTCQPNLLLLADETMMMRFFMNLISNSITYGKENGHTVITLLEQNGQITGSVADDGIGIPADQLDRIWNRFYQVDPSRSSQKVQGYGLGLTMVKWIAQAHKGQVSVSSTLGEGSTFLFSFPKNENL